MTTDNERTECQCPAKELLDAVSIPDEECTHFGHALRNACHQCSHLAAAKELEQCRADLAFAAYALLDAEIITISRCAEMLGVAVQDVRESLKRRSNK